MSKFTINLLTMSFPLAMMSFSFSPGPCVLFSSAFPVVQRTSRIITDSHMAKSHSSGTHLWEIQVH